MSEPLPEITPDLAAWIAKQRLFFVATAPSDGAGPINCSPKGLDSFRVLGPRVAAYLDLTGSGIETIAHLRENGRVTLLFCGFEGPPKIVRLYGRGTPHVAGTSEFTRLSALFPSIPGARAVIHVAVERVSTSCGMAVPYLDYRGERDDLTSWAAMKGPRGLEAYRAEKNLRSIDGLPGWPAPDLLP